MMFCAPANTETGSFGHNKPRIGLPRRSGSKAE